jgi:glycopeptide antibiotics resistance protein
MKTGKKLFAVLAVISGLIAIAAAAVIVAVMVVPTMTIRIRFFFACIVAAVVFTILAVIFLCKAIKNERAKKIIVRITVVVSFIVYLTMFFGVLFLVKAFTNHISFVFAYNKNWLQESLPNLIPLKHTIMDIYGAITGGRRVLVVLFELLGNMLAYVPLAFFLPAMFKNLRRFDSFLPTIVFITISIELFQGMFGIGSCQIDDFLLGAGCACIAFYFLRRPKVIKYLNSKYIYF